MLSCCGGRDTDRRVVRGRSNGLTLRMTEQLGLQIPAAIFALLFPFHLDAMRVGIGIVADAGQLPGDSRMRPPAGDLKAAGLNLPRNVVARPGSADGHQLNHSQSD